MSSSPRSPSEHFAEGERLLRLAEAIVEPTEEAGAAEVALIGVGHALLAAAPRRARRTPPEPSRHVGGTRGTWGLPLGRDDDKEGQS